MSRARSAAWVALIAGTAMAADARADVGVVVVAAREAPDDAAAVAAAIAAALTGHGEVVRDEPDGDARAALEAGAVPAERLAGFARVRELVEEGWRAYLEVQTELAGARLGEARRVAETIAPLDGGIDAYADTALRLGAVLDNAGRRGEADEVLRLAAALDPDRAITVQEFSPDVVAAYDRARAATPGRRELRVRVTGDGASLGGATVEIDGVAVGTAPARVDVDLGQHVVVARASGRSPRAQAVSVADGAGDLEIEVALDPDAAAALDGRPVRGQSERTTAAWLDATSTYAELDAVVLASTVVRGGRAALLAQWCDGSRCTTVIEIGYDQGDLAAAARTAVDDLRDAQRRSAPTLPSDPRLDRSDVGGVPTACRWCRPALYAGAGLAVAVAAAIVIGIAASGDDRPIVEVDPGDFTNP